MYIVYKFSKQFEQNYRHLTKSSILLYELHCTVRWLKGLFRQFFNFELVKYLVNLISSASIYSLIENTFEEHKIVRIEITIV